MGWTLRSLTTNAGYLEHSPINFPSGLTCIIGARGTCKSTIVETLRFAFDCDPARVASMIVPSPATGGAEPAATRAGLIYATLAGGAARCAVNGSNGEEYVIERNVQGPSRVFRDGVQQVDGLGVLHRIEIFSQGDLQTIAENPSRRLSLIDKPFQARRDELLRERKELGEKLITLGPRIRQRSNEIATQRAAISQLAAFRQSLTDLQATRPALSRELSSERDGFNKRKEQLDRIKAGLAVRTTVLEQARQLCGGHQALRDAATIAGSTGVPGTEALKDSLSSLADTLSGLAATIDKLGKETPEKNLAAVAASFETENARYYAVRKQQQDANEALKKEEALRQEIEKMEAIEGELAKLETLQRTDIDQRAQLRQRASTIADELYSLRAEQVRKINDEFGEHVVLTLQQGNVSDEYVRTVAGLLKGSNLKNQEEVARELSTALRSTDLVDIVESGDPKRLVELLHRDAGQMTRLVSHLLDNPEVYRLESVWTEDVLEITMFVRGEARPIHQLSRGQMATALLPLILRDAEYPLLIDQPEDDLDNAFISQTLIERIRGLKAKRQIIFVTHNANIPVLGEADAVIVMDMAGPKRAAPAVSGSVDEMKLQIIRLLEGGKDAFKQRHARYGTALS